MQNRRYYLLKCVVEEYARTAQPVASAQIQERYDVSYSSATIRNDLLTLEKEGLVYQPHISAGRVPTDQGYRVYVNEMVHPSAEAPYVRQVTKEVLEEVNRLREMNVKLKMMLLNIAAWSQTATLGKLPGDPVFEEGLEHFVRQPNVEDIEVVRDAFADLNEMKEHLDEIGNSLSSGEYELYIGGENPLPSMHKYSTIVGKPRIDGEVGTLVLIGPKHMAYNTNIALIEHILRR